jgi:predicted PurR-regulated permease PerM
VAVQRKTSRIDSPFELTVLIFGVIAFMYFTGEVLKPLALSVLLSFALAPVARFFERLGLPRIAAVGLTVVISLGLLGGVGYVVGQQLTALARRLPDYQGNIETKLKKVFKSDEQSAADRLNRMVREVTAKLEREKPAADGGDELVPIQKVQVVSQPSFQERLRWVSGPYLEFLGVGSFVFILVLFMLMSREDLTDRIVGLFGHRQVSVTTRTMVEIGDRISRYLATFALVNASFGIVIGLGLGLIGVPYAVLWGCLAALLRFFPYVGPAVAFLMPVVFSIAHFPGWMQPLAVVAFFGVVELVLSSFLEPIIYGKTTGISALSLLVAAMFWTWLWGIVGLLLSTPLTVCLAVIGKYVPALRFFATLLGEDPDLKPDVRLYQRLVALDRNGAFEVIEATLKDRPRVEVFDQVLMPTLVRAEHDAARSELDETEREFVWQVVGDVVEGLEEASDFNLASPSSAANGSLKTDDEASIDPAGVLVVGLAVHDTSDVLVLRMLGQLLKASGLRLEVLTNAESPLHLAEQVAELAPGLVIVSQMPPESLAPARYLVRRLRAQFAELPIVVGRWGETSGAALAAERLVEIGASRVVFTLTDAHDRILDLALPGKKAGVDVAGAPLPA